MGRGRPCKVHSEDPRLNELLKKGSPSWDFTDNPLFDEDNNLVETRLEQWRRWCCPDGCKMMKIADEIGDNTGKRHGQGRIIFRRSYRRAQLQKLWPGVHWEPTKAKQDCLYLLKPDTVLILDYDDRHQGRRNIFAEQKVSIENGATIRHCIGMDGANVQSIRSAELLMKYIEPQRPTSTRHVHLVANAASIMPTDVYRLANKTFWDGYDAHSDIYINQQICKLTLPELKQVCGPAPFLIARGRQARHDHVYISGLTDDERKALDLDPSGRNVQMDVLQKFGYFS